MSGSGRTGAVGGSLTAAPRVVRALAAAVVAALIAALALVGSAQADDAGESVGSPAVDAAASTAASSTVQEQGATEAAAEPAPYQLTLVARYCPSYDVVQPNRALNNLLESFEPPGGPEAQLPGATRYSPPYTSPMTVPITPGNELANDYGYNNCAPIPGWTFTLGTGHTSGTPAEPSRITGEFLANSRAVTLPSVPELDAQGQPTLGQVTGAVTVTLTDEQIAKVQQSQALWVQGGKPQDGMQLNQDESAFRIDASTPRYAFATLRCHTDDLNGDNVEWVRYADGVRHGYCYAYYVDNPGFGTIVVKKQVLGDNPGNQEFSFKGSVSFNQGGAFDNPLGDGDSVEFVRGATGEGADPWTVQELPTNGWGLYDLTCESASEQSQVTTDPATALAEIALAAGDRVVCTYTNKLGTQAVGSIELRKVWVGAGGRTTLTIGTTPGGSQIASQQTGEAGAAPLTTGAEIVAAGSHYVAESSGLSDYEASLACFDDAGAGGGVAGDGVQNGGEPAIEVGDDGAVVVGAEARVVCTFTNTRKAIPAIDKTADPAAGTVVQPGQPIAYRVRVSNSGALPTAAGDVTDTLPAGLTVVDGSISDAGTYDPATRKITWPAVSVPAGSERTFRLDVTVDPTVAAKAALTNTATWLGLTDETTHTTPAEGLAVVKTVDPANLTTVDVGQTLTYTMTVTATGGRTQTNVVVGDYLPGRDPARPTSAPATLVPDSLACEADLAGRTCAVAYDEATGRITWSLGSMTPGDAATGVRTVSFRAVVATPSDVRNVVLNVATVASERIPARESNQVANLLPVAAVPSTESGDPVVVPTETAEPVVVTDGGDDTVVVRDNDPDGTTVVQGVPQSNGTLPNTGNGLPLGFLVGWIAILLAIGSALLLLTRRPGMRH